MYRQRKWVPLLILILLSALILAACNDDPVEGVRSIELEDGALKEVYRVDEQIDFDNAFLLVTYTTGRVQRTKLTPNMVSGFSTDVPTNASTLTVQFAGFKIEWIYRVIGSSEAANSFRLNLTEGENRVIGVSCSGTENFPALGVMFEVVMTGMKLDYSLVPEDAVTVSADMNYSVKAEASSFKIVLWAKDGRTVMTDGALISFKIKKDGAEKAVLTLQRATVSDGDGDYTVPQSTIEII